VVGVSANRTCIARREIEKRSRLVFHLVGRALLGVGDTGFEPVASSVSVISGTAWQRSGSRKQGPWCPQMIAGCRID
jgi:hypothetical protein